MDPMEAENLLKKLDRRLQNVEQILPTLATKAELAAAIAPLATKAELAAAIAPLATKAELAAAIAPLATKAELHEESERTRRHFDTVAESLRDDIRLIAESQLGLQTEVRNGAARTTQRFEVIETSQIAVLAEMRQGRKQLDGIVKNHEKRIARLEVSGVRKRARRDR